MEKPMLFKGRNFSIEMKQEVVDAYGLTLWTTNAATHTGRWCKVMNAVPSVIELIDQLENWDDYLDEGVSDMEKIIIRAKEEYREEAARRTRIAAKFINFSLN